MKTDNKKYEGKNGYTLIFNIDSINHRKCHIKTELDDFINEKTFNYVIIGSKITPYLSLTFIYSVLLRKIFECKV